MKIFDLGRKEKILDLPENKENPSSIPSRTEELLKNVDADEKRKRLAKRITDMMDKIDDLSTQIYHLQQRVEVLERKTQISRLE